MIENGKESGNLLAESMFYRAFKTLAEKHLNRAKFELSRGADEQARESLLKITKPLAKAITNTTSPNLSDQENIEYLNLQQEKYSIDPNGFIAVRGLSEFKERRFQELRAKSRGE